MSTKRVRLWLVGVTAPLILGVVPSNTRASYVIGSRWGTADTRVRYHVNGSQYIDERVATFTAASGQFAYYLGSNNFSVTGTGNADGSIVERLDYSSTGDFAGGGPGAGAFYHDADDDLDIDLRDFADFQNCFDPTPPVSPACAPIHDFDTIDASDGDIDLNDYARFISCSNGPFVTPDQSCGIRQRAGVTPSSGTFGMQGRGFDILSDGFVCQNFRARDYVPRLGRWLQRDSIGYADGNNLYESFRGNSLRYVDPDGQQIQELINLILIGRFRSNEEVELALARGDLKFSTVPSGLARTTTNALEALIDPNALLNLPRGFEEGFRQPAIEVTTQRFEAFVFSQVEAGASLEEASSNLQLVALFGGDITGVAALGESVFGVELTTNEALTGSSRVLRGVQGGSQIVIFVAGPQALRNARERSAAIRAATAGAPSVARTAAPARLSVTGETPSQLLSAEVSQTFQGRIRDIVLQREATGVRFFGGRATQFGRSEGVFLTTRRLANLAPAELREVLALPPANVASQITTVQIPAGTRLFIGRVGPLELKGGLTLPGGGTQVFIPDKSGLIFGPPRSFP